MEDIGKVGPWSGEAPSSARKTRRASLFLQTSISFGGKPAMTLKVRNLSPGGMMVDCAGAPPIGTRVEAAIRGLTKLTGTIIWVKPESAGITFDQEIDPALAMKPTLRSVDPDLLLKSAGRTGGRPGLKPN